MGVIGIELHEWRKRELLDFVALRSTSHGYEEHLALVHKRVDELSPSAVILDPIGTFFAAGAEEEALIMLVRLIDMLKSRGVTIMLSSLTHAGDALEQTRIAVSSMVDTWLLLKLLETNGERNRCLYVLKSRGMAHSNQIREFLISSQGIDLIEPYVGPAGVLTGTARASQEVRDQLLFDAQRAEDERHNRLIERRQELLEQKIAALRAEFAAEELELRNVLSVSSASQLAWSKERARTSSSRGISPRSATQSADVAPPTHLARKRNGSGARGRSVAKG
jgi:circadian clock protein KaiC